MLGWDFKVDAWSWFEMTFDQDLCKNHSTLGSVAPLAMFECYTFRTLGKTSCSKVTNFQLLSDGVRPAIRMTLYVMRCCTLYGLWWHSIGFVVQYVMSPMTIGCALMPLLSLKDLGCIKLYIASSVDLLSASMLKIQYWFWQDLKMCCINQHEALFTNCTGHQKYKTKDY